MPLNGDISMLTIAGLTTALAATTGAVGLSLVPRLKRFIVPEPQETYLSDQLQFDQVLEDNVTIKGKDGSLTQTLQLEGIDLSAKTTDELRHLTIKRQSWLDLMAASGLSFKLITTREELSHDLPGEFDHPRLTQIHNAWMKQFKTTYVNRHYLVLTQMPSKLDLFAKLKSLQKGKGKNSSNRPTSETSSTSTAKNLNTLDEIVTQTLESLNDFHPKVLSNVGKDKLGKGGHQGNPHNNNREGIPSLSPLLTFWASFLNRAFVPLASHSHNISEVLTSKALSFNPSSGVITYQEGEHKSYEAVISLKTWSEESTSHLLREILSLPGRLTVLHMAQGSGKIKATATLQHQYKQAQMQVWNERSHLEFEEAIRLVEGGETTYYNYQLSIFVHGKDQVELNSLIGEVKRLFRDYGIAPVVDTGAAEWLWRCQFPGFEQPVRVTHPLSSNLASLITLERESEGLPNCDWGEGALRLFKTPSGSGYSLQLHKSAEKEALSHSVVIAPAGSGKTTLFQHLIGGALRHPNLRSYIFDRFQGTRIFTEAVGGTAIDLSQGQTPLNPLVCEDNPSNRAFLTDFLLMLAGISEQDPTSQEQVSRAVNLIMSVPQEHRTLNGVWQSAFDNGSALKQGLKRWVHEGALAGWFNGQRSFAEQEAQAYDALDLNSSRLVSFEMTDVQKNPASAAAMTTYIMHRIRSTVSNNAFPHLIFIDETAPMLEDPLFCSSVKTILREHRKLRGSVNLCFQDASGIESSGIAEVILNQCPTVFLFPNVSAKREAYQMFDLTEAQWDYIKGTNRIARHLKHSVLVKRHNESVIIDIDLSSLGPLLKLYKSGSEPVKIVKELQHKWGVDKWVEEYLA
jgi:type IV secretion/conjugal transfer VirB4 family ATPase